MKLFYKLLLLAIPSAASLHTIAQNGIQLLDDATDGIHLQCLTDGIHTADTGEGVIVRITEGTPILEAGMPDLPKLTSALIVDDENEMTVEIVSAEFTEYTDITVVPSKGNLSRTIDPSSLPYVYGSAYTTDAFYPGHLASLGDAYVHGQFRGQSIHFYPVQYNPVTHTVRVYSSIEIKVTKTDQPGINPLPATVAAEMNATMRDVYASHFLNFSMNSDRYEAISELGNMLVIYDAEYLEELQPWIQWKKEKGIEVELMDVATINSVNMIGDYVAEYYAENGLTYLMLVGDEDQVPSQLVNNSGGQGYCDPCYGYVNGNDSYVEFFVGRFLVHEDEELPAVISKVLEYEKNPNTATDWFSIAMGIGSNEGDGFGDDDQADWQHQNGLKEELLDYTYTQVHERYDGNHTAQSPTGGATADAAGSPANSTLTDVIEDGCSLINYTGHGAHSLIVTGNYTNTQINALDNHGFYPYFIIVGCCTGDFDDDDASGDTFGEAWLKCPSANYDAPTGGIGGSFSSVYQTWAPPMEGQDEMNKVITETSQAGETRHTLGSIHYHGCHGMNDAYGNAGDEMTDTWILMGDPTVQLRTAYPTDITATHQSTLFFGVSALTVNCNTEDAMVALTFEGEILATGIVSGGSVSLTFDPQSMPGVILVTITSFNTLPYQAEIELVPADGPYVVNNSNTIDDVNGNNNGLADYDESLLLDITTENVGVETATGVTGTLSTTTPGITITDDSYLFGDIDAGAEILAEDAFAFEIDGYIEDQTIVEFTITYTDSEGNTWTSTFNVVINAPAILCADGFEVDDSDGNNNGRIDAGETVIVNFQVTNSGHAATAVAVTATLSENSSYLTIVNSSTNLGVIGAEETAPAGFEVVASEDVPLNEPIVFTLLTTSDFYGSECAYEKNINQVVEDWETGDISQFAWQAEGDAEWFVTETEPYAGDYCMQSGDVGNEESTTLKLTVEVAEAGDISFAVKTSSEGDYDFLKFRIGTTVLGEWSGETDWTEVTFPIGAGTRVLRWVYDKDGIVSDGADAAWVDDIVMPGLTVVSVEEETFTQDGIDVYPNPAADRTTVEFVNEVAGEVTVTIENMLGQRVYTNTSNRDRGTHFFNVETLTWASDLYLVRVKTSTGVMGMKMIKR